MAEMASAIVELRQYTLRSGRRDELIGLFEGAFIESQETLGMELTGQFCDLDDPNRFVWLRGFSDMTSRADALAAFYGGPVWKEHRDAANATMVDSDNVLLLRPVVPGAGIVVLADRAPRGATQSPPGLLTASIQYVPPAMLPAFIRFFDETIAPIVRAAGADVRGRYQTETAANTFPALPVRDADSVFVWFAAFTDAASYVNYLGAIDAGADYRDGASAELLAVLARRPEVLRLLPTPRSRFR
jgi:hypothetical protein